MIPSRPRLPNLKAVCVFCGSSSGADPAFLAGAERLGRAIARSGRTLVYGGAKVGLMAVLADAALAEGGEVVGVIPEALVAMERAHEGLTELLVVGSMHERKAAMADRADAFIATAGGLGTLEELFEAWTWAQLGLHAKPLGLLEVPEANGFFAPLLTFLDRLVEQRFVRPEYRDMLLVDPDPDRLLEHLERYQPPKLQQWIDRDER